MLCSLTWRGLKIFPAMRVTILRGTSRSPLRAEIISQAGNYITFSRGQRSSGRCAPLSPLFPLFAEFFLTRHHVKFRFRGARDTTRRP